MPTVPTKGLNCTICSNPLYVMETKDESFTSLMLAFRGKHDLKIVLNDLLSAMLSLVSIDPDTGKHCDEDLYPEIMKRYQGTPLHAHFPLLSDALLDEMGERYENNQCPDILGEFYQTYIHTKKHEPFVTTWDESLALARNVILPLGQRESILADRGVTSGRMLLAGALICGNKEPMYGISHNLMCVKMTVINLLFSKVCNAEVMWADKMNKKDFRVSYQLSLQPYGVYRIKEKEQSTIWMLRQSALF